MKYYEVKMKIDSVMGSCENFTQRWVGYKYCKMLIGRYLPVYNRIIHKGMTDYLEDYMN